MRANAEEVPYTFLRGEAAAASRWAFAPLYAPLQPLLAQAAELLAIHRRPREERNVLLEVRVCACALCSDGTYNQCDFQAVSWRALARSGAQGGTACWAGRCALFCKRCTGPSQYRSLPSGPRANPSRTTGPGPAAP